MVAECGVKPLSAIICNEMRCSSIAYRSSQHIAILTHYSSDILCEYIKHLIPANLSVNVMNKLIHK